MNSTNLILTGFTAFNSARLIAYMPHTIRLRDEYLLPRTMISRILFLALVAALLAGCITAGNAWQNGAGADAVGASYVYRGGESPHEPSRRPELVRRIVPYVGQEPAGSIVINTKERRLYLVLADGSAIRYPVGVGRAGKQWQGRSEVDGAYVEPAWAPTDEIKRDNPDGPDLISGGASNNPMGSRALTLIGGKYAIHGTNRRESVGTYASYGCIRMFNEDIIDLFGRVGVGTTVVVAL